MSEAEKSIAVKRKVAVTKPMNRNSSPAEYSPKRKRPLGPGERASPPPYIPSRKVGSSSSNQPSTSIAAVSRQKVLSRDDVRHSLGRSDDNRGLTSASRREELLRTADNDRRAMPTLASSKVHSASGVSSSRQSELRAENRSTGRTRSSDAERGTYGREVRGDSDVDGVKNLQITARVGPLRVYPSKDTNASSASKADDRALRVTIVSGQSEQSSAEKPSNSRLRGASKQQQNAVQSSVKAKTTAVRDAREDIQKARKGEAVTTVSRDQNVSRGARVISKLAREAVQKQCQAAVLSVTTAPARLKDSGDRDSPDSRVVQCDSESSPSSGNEQDYVDDVEEVRLSDRDSEASDSKQVVVQHSPKIPQSLVAKDELVALSRIGEKAGLETEDVEDLSQMLEEAEDLDSHLLLEEKLEEKNEFTLDLDDEELSHVVEEVAAEVGEGEIVEDSKSGIRFIVTLDGVDEAQFDDGATKTLPGMLSSASGASQPALRQPSSTQRSMVSTLPPVTHTRPSLAAQAQSLPQFSSTSSTTQPAAAKLRPPKIQPFSISLRDSDDEHEEKIVTYVQAGDITAAAVTTADLASEQSGEELSALQRARMQERCRFWPACMAGSDCQYHHPTAYCKTFPNCKFGDKCLFIHPNCRFDSKCTRADCPFTHTSRRRPTQLVPTPMPPPRHLPRYHPTMPPQPQNTAICHYFPNCLNPSCPFVHPKPCMYGQACKNPTCSFYHPASISPPVVTTTLPDKGKLKWQAQPSVQTKVARSATVSSTSQ